MLKSFWHTGFVVRDIESSVAFYTDVMGLELTARRESPESSSRRWWGSRMPTSR